MVACCLYMWSGNRKIVRFIYIIVSPLADKASRAAASSPTRNVSTGARIFIKIYFDFMSLLFRSFFLFRVFRSRRVQCQKCQAVFFWFSCCYLLVFGMRPARAFCQPQKLLAIFWVSCHLSSLALSLYLALFVLSCGS